MNGASKGIPTKTWGVLVGAALFLALLPGVPSAGAEPTHGRAKLAVLDLRDKGVGAEVASLLTSVVSNRLAQIGIFEVISREDIQNILTHEQDRMLLGCTDESCLINLGGRLQGALGADMLVAGEIGMVGKQHVISLQRIDIKNARVDKRTERQFEGSRERLLEEVGNAAYLVVEDILAAQSGRLLVNVSEAGADLAVDGKLVGTSPLAAVSVPAGPRDLRVVKKGFVDWTRTIQMEPQSVSTLEVTLIPSAELIQEYEDRAGRTRLWAWITLGAFIALEAGAVGLRSYTYLNFDPIENDYRNGNYRGLTADQFWQKYHGDMDTAEIMDYTALGLGLTGVAVGVLSLYFFLEGDDPGKYVRFRGLAGDGAKGMLWELDF